MSEEPQNRNGNGRGVPRDAKGRFGPGNNANPGGRPKGLAAHVRDAYPAADMVADMLKVAKGQIVAKQKPTIADMVRAREWLADRGYGKAASFVALEGGDPLELGAVDEAIAGVVDELAARREAAPAERAAVGEVEPGPQTGADTASG